MQLRPINITINGIPFRVWENELTYEEIIDMIGIPLSQEQRSSARKKTVHVEEGWNVIIK